MGPDGQDATVRSSGSVRWVAARADRTNPARVGREMRAAARCENHVRSSWWWEVTRVEPFVAVRHVEALRHQAGTVPTTLAHRRDSMAVAYIDLIRENSERIAQAYAAKPDGRVPWSERWSVGTVARHVAGTHHVVAGVVAGRPTADFGLFASLQSPEKNDPGFLGWFARGTAAMCERFEETPEEEPCWNWSEGDAGQVRFWPRRMAHECVIHRWDAQMGERGSADSIVPQVAADGIDEFLDIFVAAGRAQSAAQAGPTVFIEARDTGDSWSIELPVGGRIIRRDATAGDAQLRGDAADLLLLLWGRLSTVPEAIAATGPLSDRATVARLLPAM